MRCLTCDNYVAVDVEFCSRSCILRYRAQFRKPKYDRSEIIRQYLAGIPLKELAHSANCSVSTVMAVVKTARLPKRTGRQFGTCLDCGEVFERRWSEKRKYYEGGARCIKHQRAFDRKRKQRWITSIAATQVSVRPRPDFGSTGDTSPRLESTMR